MSSQLRDEARKLWQQGDHGAFFDVMNRAVRLEPGNPKILLEVGSAHAMRYDYAAAEAAFERAVAVSPDKTGTLESIGLLWRNANRYGLAANFFKRAAGRTGVSADTLTKLAEMHERLRCLDEARQDIGRALRLEPENPLALLHSHQ